MTSRRESSSRVSRAPNPRGARGAASDKTKRESGSQKGIMTSRRVERVNGVFVGRARLTSPLRARHRFLPPGEDWYGPTEQGTHVTWCFRCFFGRSGGPVFGGFADYFTANNLAQAYIDDHKDSWGGVVPSVRVWCNWHGYKGNWQADSVDEIVGERKRRPLLG